MGCSCSFLCAVSVHEGCAICTGIIFHDCSKILGLISEGQVTAVARFFVGNEKNIVYTPRNTIPSTNKLHHARDDSENVFCIPHSIYKYHTQSRQTKKLSYVKTAYFPSGVENYAILSTFSNETITGVFLHKISILTYKNHFAGSTSVTIHFIPLKSPSFTSTTSPSWKGIAYSAL